MNEKLDEKNDEGGPQGPPSECVDETPVTPPVRYWRPAEEPTCCGSGCIDCPF
jgi:hypothetical protein